MIPKAKDLRFTNHYRCECGAEWSDEWSCMCNDRCPECDSETEPHESEDNEMEDMP